MRIVVVGAGIVGLSAAWWLTRLGHAPIVLDQGPIPNPIASSFDGHRLIRLAHSVGDGRGRIIHEAYAAWDELWADLGRAHHVETGTLMVASEPGDWAFSCRAGFDRSGTPYELWDRQRLARRCPWLLLDDGAWGLFTAQGGALLADRILEGLVAWLGARGVALRGRAEIVAVDGARAEAWLADGERLAGDSLIVAAGAWAGRLLPTLVPRLEPRRALVLYLAPPPEMAAWWHGCPCLLDLGRGSDLYLVPPMEGLGLKFGSGDHSRPGDPTAPRTLLPDEPESLLAHLRPFVRALDRYQVTEARVCYTCYSPDERFIADKEGRMAYATGCSGQMFKFGALMGRRLAEAVTGVTDGAALAAWARGEGSLRVGAHADKASASGPA
jgi:sarcosine oxidase